VTDLRIQVITAENEFAALGDQWQQLAVRDEQAMLFNDWQWNSLWWQHYKHLGHLHILLVFNEQQLVGIGPFYRNRSKAFGFGKMDTLRFIGTGANTSPDDVNIVADPTFRRQVADALCDYLFRQKFQRMLLMEVSEKSTFYSVFRSRAQAMPGYSLEPVVHSRRYANLPKSWSVFREQISRNTHKRLKRRKNRLDATKAVEFKICRTQSEIDVAFDALVRLHMLRWKTRGHTGSFGSEDYRLFHQNLVRELLLREQLWLITLEVEGVIVGVEYAFLYKQTLMFFQTGFDPEFAHLSPGHVLMTYAIKTAIESGVERIDMLKGDYQYKASYANEEVRSVNFGFYSKGLFSVAAKMNDYRRYLKQT